MALRFDEISVPFLNFPEILLKQPVKLVRCALVKLVSFDLLN